MHKTVLIHTPLSAYHLTGSSHPESPLRYTTILNALDTICATQSIEKPCPIKWLLLAHDRRYIQLVKKSCEQLTQGQVATLSTGDVNICSHSFDAARAAVACALYAADAIMKNTYQNAFVLARPPGHHATRERGMGFCLFNTAAIAARYLQYKYRLNRIAIVDWDAHFGNGTASIVSDNSSILYTGTHKKGAYPAVDSSNSKSLAVSSRKELMAFYTDHLPRLLSEFKPECICLSCGFDAHVLDPLASLGLSSQDFETLTQCICSLAKEHCSGKILSILEGGYNLQALEECVRQHLKSLSKT